MRMGDKVAIITGGTGSLGSATTRLLAQEAAKVVIVDRVEDSGGVLEEELNEHGKRMEFICADVANVDHWERIVRTTLEVFGRIDVLVNNAGVSSNVASDPFDLEAWNQIIDVNLRGPFFGIRSVLPVMIKQGAGSIVNVSSIGALVGLAAGHLGYAPSKAGIAALSRTVAARYGRDGIRSNTVYPGAMPGMRTRSAPTATAGNHTAVSANAALGRAADAAEVAQGILFLASDEASYVTGADLVIDGGYVSS